jgi:hypothetical protein
MDVRSAQNLGWENKLAKGSNVTDVPLEFCLLNSEVAEAFDYGYQLSGYALAGPPLRIPGSGSGRSLAGSAWLWAGIRGQEWQSDGDE